jgi:hypothetical protein
MIGKIRIDINREGFMPQLHETRMGQQLITSTLPRIATALEQLVELLTKKQEADNTDGE